MVSFLSFLGGSGIDLAPLELFCCPEKSLTKMTFGLLLKIILGLILSKSSLYKLWVCVQPFASLLHWKAFGVIKLL